MSITMKIPETYPHPQGELNKAISEAQLKLQNSSLSVDTFNGKVQIEWDPDSATTPFGQLPFFIDFLKTANLFEPWVDDCPLNLTSPNAPSKRDLLGTLLLSTLAGHTRYAHITAIRNDGVNPGLLGMTKVVSEDSARRCLAKVEEENGSLWLQKHLAKCYLPLLGVPWILDMDTTVKPLYGHQEGAVVGYNPQKPGRPSHSYHTYSIANLRLILDVEVAAGNHSATSYTSPGLWNIIDNLPINSRPQFIRGDCAFGNDNLMRGAEIRNLSYLFKLKQTKNVKLLIKRLLLDSDWSNAGQGWEGVESSIQLSGWEINRRVIVLRKKITTELMVLTEEIKNNQREFNFGTVNAKTQVYEYAVLVTNLATEIHAVAQHYRDRADCENTFDEMKNQWGWCGFTTQDLHRCKLMARIIALVYNWWNLFVRLANPDKHLEAITSRPLLLHGIGKQTKHAGQNKIKLNIQHGESGKIQLFLGRISSFFNELRRNAEQLTLEQRWYQILSKAMEKYLNGRQLEPPNYLSQVL